jgi:hypothetical protein
MIPAHCTVPDHICSIESRDVNGIGLEIQLRTYFNSFALILADQMALIAQLSQTCAVHGSDTVSPYDHCGPYLMLSMT